MRCRVASLIPPRPCNARSTVPIDTFAISAIKWIPCLSLPIGTTPWDILHLQNCSASHTMLFACTLTVLYFAASTIFPWRFTIVHERRSRNCTSLNWGQARRTDKCCHSFRLPTFAFGRFERFGDPAHSRLILENQNPKC